MTEQEWLDGLAAQLPERDLEWVVELARICSTEWTGDKPPTGEACQPAGTSVAGRDGDRSRHASESTGIQASS
ncbi:hypothetical protein [Streptomyces soliscabiei]|uniref:hypothetical protein n=1 Tax=Streptomyces soliscabiei TaxID=588897 RepID=UPI0029A42DC2|nr:hypothetical protein [Streptomyces sp. NY05-11A]MDX2679394.1 hypothetical protein [Streptomyces sp. NY05-11A]